MLRVCDVYFIEQAERDLYDIYCYVAIYDSEAAAENLFKKLADQSMKLAYLPERGNYPKELKQIGVFDFRELNVKPHRIIYQIIDGRVFIHAILDGRRDLEDCLMRRLVVEHSESELI